MYRVKRMIKERHIGCSEVPPIGFGCMGLSEFYGEIDHQSSLDILHQAFEYGYRHFDTADMYGRGRNEELIGDFLKSVGASNREELFICTKAGIVRDSKDQYSVSINSSYEYIIECCNNSLSRLKTDYIDLFYAHRLNPNEPIEEALRALSDLKAQGKIRAIGLCEVSSDIVTYASSLVPVSAVQSEYSLWTRDVEESIITTCENLGIAFVAFSPLGRGFLTGNIDQDYMNNSLDENDFRKRIPRFNESNIEKNRKTLASLLDISTELGITPAQISLAWLLSKSSNIHVIPGTKRINYMKQNFDASSMLLPQHVLAQLDLIFLPKNIYGERYPSSIARHSA
jgi:aryl-alcohol dehydrogenase-like predicted oxidoreductase